MTAAKFELSTLKERPEFCAIIADRVWRAWWETKGVALAAIESRVQENLNPKGFPLAVVAHDADSFIGTASVTASDMDERPRYSPWVAAVWVDPQHRGRGVGAAVVQQAGRLALDRGFKTIYLCALPEKRGFYERLGWRLLEEDVGEDRLRILTLSR